MERIRCHALVLAIVLLPLICRAQVDRIVCQGEFARGRPFEQALVRSSAFHARLRLHEAGQDGRGP